MPASLSTTHIQQFLTTVQTQGVEGAARVYADMQAMGYGYAGWAGGVGQGNTVTGREALDFLTGSAAMGTGMEVCRNLPQAQIDKIRVDMAEGYLKTMLDIAQRNGGTVDRDVRYRETEQFHKETFEKNGLSLENWTLKTPMDLLGRMGDDAVEKMWGLIRSTKGEGLDALLVSGVLAGTVAAALASPDPAVREKAKKWIDTVLGRDVWDKIVKLEKFAGSLLNGYWTVADQQARMDRLAKPVFSQAREDRLEVIRSARMTAEGIFVSVISPLVLDLDGDGVETLSIERNVRFDHNGNYFAERTGWVNPDDGFLAYDRNGNGEIDDGSELFGSYTRLQNGSSAPNGFIALAEFDADRNGWVDANDPVFSSLKVWRDLNRDGITQPEELLSLEQAGVAALSTRYENSNKIDSQGNERRQIGQYVRTDGTSVQMHDVWLERNNMSQADPDATPWSAEVHNLPEIRGFGSLKSLRTAMSSDEVLRGYVEEFTRQFLPQQRSELVNLIVLRWTGADRVTFGVDSPYYDERKLFALDVASGEEVYDRNYNERPSAGPQANSIIEAGYAELCMLVSEELERQITLSLQSEQEQALELELLADANGDLYFSLKNYAELRVSKPEEAFARLLNLVQSSGQDLLKLGWNGYDMLRQEIAYFSTIPAMATFMRDVMNVTQGAGAVAPIDMLTPAVMLGSSGNDTLQGSGIGKGSGQTIFYGDAGNDVLTLNKDDTFIYGVGCGNDQLLVGWGPQTVVFDATVRPEEVAVSYANDNLVITLVSGETLTVRNWFYEAKLSEVQIKVNRFVFADGTMWQARDIGRHLIATGGADLLPGTYLQDYINAGGGDDRVSAGAGADFVRGGTGNDVLEGNGGHDVLLGDEGNDSLVVSDSHSRDFLVGGAGNDWLSGEGGADTYYFERGFGRDTLIEKNQLEPNRDTVIFGPGLRIEDLRVTRNDSDLFLTFQGGTDVLQLQSWFGAREVEHLLFDDGTVLTAGQLLARVFYPVTGGNDAIVGTRGNDTLRGEAGDDSLDSLDGDDLLIGGTGNDTLSGGAGAETYEFSPGDGWDVIYDNQADGKPSTIVLNMRPDQVRLSLGGYDNASLLLDIGNGAQGIEVSHWVDREDITDSLQVRFSDGTVWNSQDLWRNASTPAGSAQLYGTPENELITGDAQANRIHASAGADTLDGGSGSDTLQGGTGNDTYLFKRGMGADVVYDSSGSDVIQVAAGISLSDLTINRQSGTTTITLNGSSDRLSIEHSRDAARVEFLRLFDGSTIDLFANAAGPTFGDSGNNDLAGTYFNDRIEGLGGNDTINSGNGNDFVLGGDGDDLLYSSDGADTLQGGAGNDTVVMDSDDVVLFDRGDGIDTIYRDYEARGVLRFGAGILPSDLVFRAEVNRTLRVSLAGTADSMGIAFWFNFKFPDNTLSRFEFADGMVWSLQDIRNRMPVIGTAAADWLYGSAAGDTLTGEGGNDVIDGWAGDDRLLGSGGHDSLLGGAGNDTLEGGSGNDTLQGNGGNNTFVFQQGFGSDVVVQDDGLDPHADRIVFGSGISSDDVVVTGDNQFTPGSQNNLYLTVLGTGERITLAGWFNAHLPGVESVQFDDGTHWDRAALLQKFYAFERGGLMFGSDTQDNMKGDDGDDQIEARDGNDLVEGFGGDDSLFGDAGNDTLAGGSGDDLLFGGIGDDTYVFGRGDGIDRIADFDRVSGNDRLVFRAGIAPTDVLVIRESDDIVLYANGGNSGTDAVAIRWFGSDALKIETVVFDGGQVWSAIDLERMAEAQGSIQGTDGADALTGTSGDDRIFGLGGNDSIDGGGGADALHGGAGDDRYTVDRAEDVVVEAAAEGIDEVTSSVSYVLPEHVEHLVLQGQSLSGTGNALSNSIVGGSGNDTLDGGLGADSLQGGLGDDTYIVDNTDDLVIEVAGGGTDQVLSSTTWILGSEVEHLVLTGADSISGFGNNLNNRIVGNAQANTLDGVAGADTLEGGMGDDTYVIDSALDVVTEALNEGYDRVESSVSHVLAANVESLTLTGTATINGTGNAGSDALFGNDGNNRLDGGGNYDSLIGGAGDDVYVVDHIWDSVIEAANAGIDTVEANLSWTLAAEVEHLLLTGSSAINGTGNASANLITGNTGVNVLTGLAGNDTLDGGLGNDSLDGGAGNDTVLFGRGDGRDTLAEATADASAGKLNVLRFKAGIAQADITVVRVGTTLEARINGSSDAVVVTDFFYNNDPTSSRNPLQRIEFADGSAWSLADIVQRATPANSAPVVAALLADRTALEGTALSIALPVGSFTDPDAGDVLTYSATLSNGSALPSWLNFNASTRTFSGTPPTLALGTLSVRVTARDSGNLSVFDDFNLSVSAENKVLTGGTGADVLTGYSGNDSLSGAASNDTLIGAAGNDTLDGGTGNDSMTGGTGNDLYRVDSATDVVVEVAGEGTDTVEASTTYTLGTNVENLVLTGTAVINGSGNASANSLTGNSVANRLDGGAGIDTMAGGAGDDVYVVDNTADVVTEAASAGTDRVESSVSYTLGNNVENLTLTGTAINATGNTAANALVGNSGANRLDGGTGIDTMTGGTGDDVYVVDNTADVVTEAASAGTDTVEASVSLTLATNVENLTLTGTTAINATGNTQANTLRGNSGANTLNGGTGTDTMIGGAGNDTYVVDTTTDVVTELASEGTDLVQSGVTYTLAANVENLTLTGTTAINGTGNTLDNVLTGNSANNTLTAGAGHDTINGGTGNDTMVGGAGNDTYTVNVSTDVVTELASEGTDLVQSAVTYTLGTNVENLTLLGTTAFNGTGNTLNNTLTGNSAANVLTGGAGNDTLDGAAGADSLRGGTGDDVYWVDVSTDVLTENANEGIDSVNAGLTWTLATNFENLSLAGTGAFNGTGNTVANAITGNSGANTLTGLAGNDTLNGNGGNDALIGGVGADTYVFNRGHGQDTVQENDTTANVRDSVQFASGITQANLSYQRVGNNLEALLSASTDKLIFTNWYLGNQYHVEDFRFGDGSVLTDTQVQGLVSAMASFSAPASVESGTSSTWRATQPDLVVSALA